MGWRGRLNHNINCAMTFGNPKLCCWFMCVLHVLFVILLQIHVQLKQGFNKIITTYIISSKMKFLNTKNDLFLKEHKSNLTRKLCWIWTRMNMFGQRHIDKSHVCESICSNYEDIKKWTLYIWIIINRSTNHVLIDYSRETNDIYSISYTSTIQ